MTLFRPSRLYRLKAGKCHYIWPQRGQEGARKDPFWTLFLRLGQAPPRGRGQAGERLKRVFLDVKNTLFLADDLGPSLSDPSLQPPNRNRPLFHVFPESNRTCRGKVDFQELGFT